MSEPTIPPEIEAVPKRGKGRFFVLGCVVPVAVAALLLVALVWNFKNNLREKMGAGPGAQGAPAWVDGNHRFVPWATPGITYDGPGKLVVYMDNGCKAGAGMADPPGGVIATGKGVTCRDALASVLVPSPRELAVHLPAGYDEAKGKLPLIVAFHGFGQRPGHSVYAFAKALDAAQAEGRLPLTVTAFVDSSLGGTGLDDKRTPWDENGGSWGVNSNIGQYSDHFRQEMLPHLLATYRISERPDETILLGGSMGGTIAINRMIEDPKRFPLVGAFYPGLDLRYSCGGEDRLANYNADCYRSIENDDPKRKMTTHEGVRGRLFTERMFLFPVFDSDRKPGPAWTEDKPVWQRVRENNPTDRLRDAKPNLAGVKLWYLVGDQDDFNIDAQRHEFDKLAEAAGIALYPADHVREGRHDMAFFHQYTDEAIAWMNKELTGKN
jgi:S-formylglutathione hydrolase FrmB